MPIDNTLHLYQYKDGYRYNSDSLVLYDFIANLNPFGNVLDVGSGSGIIGLLTKRDFPNTTLSQIDIQSLHVELTLRNAQHNKLDSNVLHINILEAKFECKFDFIVTNPPFYNDGSQKSKNEVLKVSRYAQTLPFDELCKAVSRNLKPNGSFVFCYDAKQVDTLMSTLVNNKFKVNSIRFVYTKKDKTASLILIHAKKSSKSLCKILAPLYMDSREMEDIYKITKTQSLLWTN